MIQYQQSTGKLTREGRSIWRGYAGHGAGKNNPAMEGVVATGPLPRGRWRMTGVYDSQRTGPFTITLHAIDATPGNDRHDATGRSAFRIHGDSKVRPGEASNGCIILPREIRELMWRWAKAGDDVIEVIA